jgi:transaldolase
MSVSANVNERLAALTAAGTSVWLDQIRRNLITSGELERLVREDSLRGVTSNPAIFEKAILGSTDYDEQIAELAGEGLDARQIYEEIAITDVRLGCDVLRPVWDEAGGADGFVSLEVEPAFAHKAEDTLAQARDFWKRVDRPNLFVKIPGTEPGLGAIEDCIAAGRSINITLIFSLERHAQVIEAYLRGLERLVAGGGDPAPVASVASFFVSRVDTEADRRLDELGREDLQGKLAIANAKLAYQQYLKAFSGDRWAALAAEGATPQRCLWASTSTKNPAYRDVLYVEELIGPNTVNTMPLETVTAFQEHGAVRDTLAEGVEEARELLGALAEAGVDYDDVVATLEREGVEKFADSLRQVLEGIEAKRSALVV